MTCFSCRVAAKFDIVICKYIVLFLFWKHNSPTFLTSTWPELACSLSAQPVTHVLSCKCTVVRSSSNTHRHHFVLYSPSLCYRLSGDWGCCKERKETIKKKEKKELWLQAQAKQYRDQSYKRNAAGTVWQNTPIPTYLPTHPPQERFSVSTGATQSGRDSKYSTV